MLLYYVDASADQSFFILTALRIVGSRWKDIFERTKEFRRYLKSTYGIYLRKELHSTELIRGKGRLAPADLGKGTRARIVDEALHFIAGLPEVQILNICITVPHCPVDPYVRAFERLLNRIEANLKAAGSNGVVILDEGKEGMIRRVARKMAVFNWVPSAFGVWHNGEPTKNIVVSRVLEDPIFRRSSDSYFLQFVDIAAFALLKREVTPTPVVQRYRIHRMFDTLKPVLCREVSPNDPDGIERG